MTNSANLPAPYGGQNTNTPNAVLKSPQCETLLNFNTTEAGITLRKGDSLWASKAVNSAGGVTVEVFNGFVPFGASQLFLTTDCDAGVGLRYYSINSVGAPVGVYTSTTIIGVTGQVFSTYYQKNVFTFSTIASTGDIYDGTTWGAWGYTMPATYNPIGGCAYKRRQYFIFRDTASYGYSNIDSITGTVTRVDLAGEIAESSNLAIITPITISNETSSVKLLAFVFFSGEVLFYSGSYPDSDSWSLVATANLAEPLNYNSVISPYRGDSLVATRNGLVSLRDLFLRGSDDAAALLISLNITPDWTNLVELMISGGIVTSDGRIEASSVAWWKRKNRIIVSFPRYIDSAGALQLGSTYFILDTLRGGWTIHRSFGIDSFGTSQVVYFKRNILFCSSAIANAGNTMVISQKEGATDYQDIGTNGITKVNYDYSMLSAPIPFEKTADIEVSQIEPIMQSDLYTQTNWNLVADFGKQTSGSQPLTDQGVTVTKPAVNVGMHNITYCQVKMSGTTTSGKTVGLDLYSYNIWFNKGEKASR